MSRKRFVVFAFAALLCCAVFGCAPGRSAQDLDALQTKVDELQGKVDTLSAQNDALSEANAELKAALEEQLKPTQPPDLKLYDGEYTYGDTVKTADIEITFGGKDSLKWSHIQNRYSDLDGAEVFAIPVHVKNATLDPHSFNVFICSKYGPDGTREPLIESYFEDDANYIGEMRPGDEAHSYMYFLYQGDGEYRAVFDDLKSKSVVRLPVTKDIAAEG